MAERSVAERSAQLLTVAEIAGELRLGRQGVLAFLRRRGIPVILVGRAYRVRRADLDVVLCPVPLTGKGGQ